MSDTLCFVFTSNIQYITFSRDVNDIFNVRET